MPIAITAPEAVELLREHGHQAENMVALSGGLWSAAFAFREAGREYVVRFHERRDDLEKDRFAQRWASDALLTPRVVEIEDTARGPYGIAERITGGPIDDLDEAGFRHVLPSLFSAMDAVRVADLSGTSGYGLWHGDGNGNHASWRDTLVREEAPGERAKQREALGRSGVGSREFDIGLERMHELLPFCLETRHLVHNDLLYRNVFVDRGRVVLLDWGASIYGDFLYDVALLTFWWPWYERRWGGIDIRYEIERHYAANGVAIPNYAERLRCCELDIGISAIAFQVGRGDLENGAWTARRTTKLAAAALADST